MKSQEKAKIKRTILIVEDEEKQFEHLLNIAKEADLNASLVSKLSDAQKLLEKNSFDIVLTDMHLSGQGVFDSFEGIQIISMVAKDAPNTTLIGMSADPLPSTYDKAMKAGAWHFAKKPIRSSAELKMELDSARDRHLLTTMATAPSKKVSMPEDLANKCPDGLVLSDQLRKTANKLAQNPKVCTILYGETGTGKEEIARLIYKRRVEHEGRLVPFVAVNCAHLDGDLAMSSLFGHAKGAFTGADKTTLGYVGEADGGILFLDEIHTLSMQVQQKLLRVLNDGSYNRVGETKELHAQFQLIVASTRNLEAEVESLRFLLDLYSRISGFDLELPPLRKRIDDIPLFVRLFVFREKLTVDTEELNKIIKKCQSYYWQGNIRQLFKALQGMAINASLSDEKIKVEHLPEHRLMLKPIGMVK